MDLFLCEAALAAEAAAHARATAELNPYSEAEAEEFGAGFLVYSGSLSPVHGAYGLGLSEPLEERDFAAVERFFARKERPAAFWATPFTDPSLLERLAHTHRPTRRERLHGLALEAGAPEPQRAAGSSTPEHGLWALAFSRATNPKRREPDLFSLTKVHQRETRFYLHGEAASYTYFHRGIALVPSPAAGTLALQEKEARGFRATALVVVNEPSLPLLYERILHEPLS